MESIIQSEKKCWVTGSTQNLHCHHVYGGGRRRLSERYGLKIWLRADWHNTADYGIHNNAEFANEVKAIVQSIAMEHYNWSIDDFVRLFGKNYLK